MLQINGIPYLEKTGHFPNESYGEFFFKKVTTTIHGTGRFVTYDDWLTTYPLLKNMLKDPYEINVTGTIRKNKKEISNEIKIAWKDTTAHEGKHWPLRFFFGMLDQAQENARILYSCKFAETNNPEKNLSAKSALKQLICSLLEPYLREKLENPTLRPDIRKRFSRLSEVCRF